MDERSAVTVIPVLAGFWPPETWTVSVVGCACKTVLGLAEPKPEIPVQSCVGDELLCGAGAPETKSFALSSVSKHPSFNLRAAVVFTRSGAGPDPSKHTG